MAKLNGVFVSEDATKIIVGGVEYVKSEGKAEAGDIVRITFASGSYLTTGAFYEVTGGNFMNPLIVDNTGDEMYVSTSRYDVFKRAKAAAEPAPKYREVKRKARVGERIKIVSYNRSKHATPDSRVAVGDVYTVKLVDGDGDVLYVNELNLRGLFGYQWNEYVVLESVSEPVEAAPPARLTTSLSVGDYAKVIDDSGSSSFKVGDIVRKTEERHYGGRFSYVDGTNPRCPFMDAEYYVRATDEEVAAAKAEVERKKAEEAKWAAIGRKVGEYKKGDIVKVTSVGSSQHKVGDIGVIDTEFKPSEGFRVKTPRINSVNWLHPDRVELIAPVEALFNGGAAV